MHIRISDKSLTSLLYDVLDRVASRYVCFYGFYATKAFNTVQRNTLINS